MKPTIRLSLVFSILLLSIISLSPLAGISSSVFMPRVAQPSVVYSSSDLNQFVGKEIKILFDSEDSITRATALELKKDLHSPLINVQLVEVRTFSDFLSDLTRPTWANLYVFHGSEKEINIGNQGIPWENLARILDETPVEHHVFEACHSIVLDEFKGNFHGVGASTDAKLAVLDSLVYLIEQLDQSPLESLISDKLTALLAQKFLTNLPEILVRALVPIEALDSVDTLTINLTSDDSLVRGPWGWLTRMLLAGWLDQSSMEGNTDWYSVTTNSGNTLIDINKTLVNQGGIKSTTELNKINLGSGDGTTTGAYPFDIPLTLEISPEMGQGPWYFPEYVDLDMAITTAKIDLAKATGLDKIMDAAGYDVKLTLDPSLWGGLRVGNYVQELAGQNPILQDDPVTFLGGGLTIKLHFEIGIPLATFLDYIIPGSGKAIANILKLLQIKVNLLNVLDVIIGMGYNATAASSMESVLLKVGMGFQIDAKLPSFKSLIKKAIGLDIPLGFLQLGMKLRGTAGVAASAKFGPEGDGFKVGLFYSMMYKFWINLFWFLKFDWENSWKHTIWLLEAVSNPSTPKTDEHVNLDLDKDGLADSVEPSLGLNNQSQDTDQDGLSDGMEIKEYYTDPLLKDSDNDGLNDGNEVAEFYKLNLNPIADYDNDGIHCLLDPDSDNDGLTDRDEILGLPFDVTYNRNTKTNPSLVDTDWDGLTDLEEYMWTDQQREENHTDPLVADTDGDGIKDGAEHYYYLHNQAGHPWPMFTEMDTIDFLLDPDSDNDLLNDGFEKFLGTDPLDIDTDGDYDLNDNNIIDPAEILTNDDYPAFPGNLTDYGEYIGNYWQGGPFVPDGACQEPWPIPTNPLALDTDGDGSNDTTEWSSSTKPVEFDADGDGISNDIEHNFFKTICNDTDTDNDALLDGFELNYFRGLGFTDTEINNSGYLLDIDSDDDGLIDGLEYYLGSNLLDNDSDDDNYLDGEEFFKGTFILDPDTDNDGVLDGDEVHTHRSNPFLQDTDNDGLSDFIEVNEQIMNILNIGRVDNIFTNASDPDSDDDGLLDGEEVFGWRWSVDRRVPLGSTSIMPVYEDNMGNASLIPYYAFPDPYRARFQTNPVSDDTDGDGLPDGKEKDMVTSPLTSDTDGDGLSDWFELDMMMNTFGTDDINLLPKIWHHLDYDGDGLTDYDEYFNGTEIRAPDSDSDGLTDWDEITMPVTFTDTEVIRDVDGNGIIHANVTGVKKYTSPIEPDSDYDGLLDGEELNTYGTDPTNPDSDFDGLSDLEELYGYRATLTGIDGPYDVYLDPNNPDTDADGIFDGDEVGYYENRQSLSGIPADGPLGDKDMDALPNILDTDADNDGIPDGIEILNYTIPEWPWSPSIGSDPLFEDQNSDGIVDGHQTDFDFDDLSDWRETMLPAPSYNQPVGLEINGGSTTNYKHIINHTLFLLHDTDDDGYSDGDEVLTYLTDPLDPGSAPVVKIESINWYETEFTLDFLTASDISNLYFNQDGKQVGFTLAGEDGTSGSCRVSVPKSLLDSPNEDSWVVYLDGDTIPFDISTTDISTSFFFTYNHSVHEVIIEGTWVVEVPTTLTTTEKKASGWSIWILLLSICVALPLRRMKKKLC